MVGFRLVKQKLVLITEVMRNSRPYSFAGLLMYSISSVRRMIQIQLSRPHLPLFQSPRLRSHHPQIRLWQA